MLRSRGREDNGNGSSSISVGIHGDASSVFPDNAQSRRQAEAKTAFVSTKEWLKDAAHGRGRDSWTVIFYGDGHSVVISLGSYFNVTTVTQRLNGIIDKVQKNL